MRRFEALACDRAELTLTGCAETPASRVFTGAMGWYSNEDAMLYFIDTILPAIRHLLLADDVEDFAHTVASLLRDPGCRQHLARAGRRLVEEQHSWIRVAQEFEVHGRGSPGQPKTRWALMAMPRRPGTFAGRSAVFSDWHPDRFGVGLGHGSPRCSV